MGFRLNSSVFLYFFYIETLTDSSSASLKRWHLRAGTCAFIADKATNKEQVSSVIAGQQTFARTKKR